MPSSTVLRLRELPRTERPRERLKDLGANALSTTELLAILIGSGTAGSSALVLAQDALSRSEGSLRRLASQPVAALTAVHGLGSARAVAIHAALELGRRLAAESRDEGAPLRTPRDVWAAYAPRLEDLPVEEFHVAVLDAQHRLERDITITRGILNSSLVHPREVFRAAIEKSGAQVLPVDSEHNAIFQVLGSGDASEADLVVVNTCAFIESARQESIDTVLELADLRRDGARLVVTGCMAERYGSEISDALPASPDPDRPGASICWSWPARRPRFLGPT